VFVEYRPKTVVIGDVEAIEGNIEIRIRSMKRASDRESAVESGRDDVAPEETVDPEDEQIHTRDERDGTDKTIAIALRDMRYLVTGGAGFIGSNFVHYLLETTDHEVVTLDALTYAGERDNLAGVLDNPSHEFVEGDIRDRELAAELIADADVVVNFAAESHVDRSIDDAAEFVQTNVEGTQALLEAAREHDVERFVQISTDEVYGEIESGTFSSDDRLKPRNPYAATKAGADLLARSYRITYDVPVIITRSSNNYGPRQHREKLIPKFITRAAAGESLPVYGDGTNVREWTYVRDNCRAIQRVIEDGEVGEIYNVGSGEEHTNLEITRRILSTVGASDDLIEFVEDRQSHDQRYALDTHKIESLGWEPEWTLEEGLSETVQYYLDSP
jgi:dTDP-glucose 4,6-dehydratase